MKTMVVYLKRIVMCCLMFVVVNAIFAQDYQAKHEVQRGETLAGIAKQYGVTEQMIKDANPQMGNLFYVGLKLNIPQKIGKIEEKKNAVDETNYNVEEKKTFSYSTAYDEASGNISVEKENYVRANEYSFNLDFDDPFTIGFSAAFDDTKYSFFYMGLGLSSFDFKTKTVYDDITYGSCVFGYGAKQRFVYDAFLLQVKVFPYIGLLMTDYYEGKDSKSDYDFTYGAAGNVSVGLKAWTTSKGNDAFITIGYYIEAPEFKTKNMVKNGSWLFGLTLVLNN